MVDNNGTPIGASGFKEAVCIDAGRVFDSCSDKDCLEDLQVYFTDSTQSIIDSAMSVKTRKIEVLNVYTDIEPVPFNKGFYSVDMTFFFNVNLDVYTMPMTPPVCVDGLSIFNKKVILYGSEGSVRVFSSDDNNDTNETVLSNNLPKASVQVVDPICLATTLCENQKCGCDPVVSVPRSIARRYDGDFCDIHPKKTVQVTLGLFSIVQLERSVQMMVPVYDYCVPDKECVATSDDPCELFKRIKFPINEFFPPRLSELDSEDTVSGSCCAE